MNMSVNPFSKDCVKVINGSELDIMGVGRKCKRTDKEPDHCYSLVVVFLYSLITVGKVCVRVSFVYSIIQFS